LVNLILLNHYRETGAMRDIEPFDGPTCRGGFPSSFHEVATDMLRQLHKKPRPGINIRAAILGGQEKRG
jgi:hypothetical protein